MTIKIGVNPLSWFNSDIPSLGASIPMEQVLSETALIGYRGIELEDRLAEDLVTEPDILEQRGLSLVGGWHATQLLENDLEVEREQLRRHCCFLKRFGGTVAILADTSRATHREASTPLSSKPVLNDAEWDRLTAGLEILASDVASYGMTSAYHHHIGTGVQNAEEVDRLMEQTKQLGLLFDVGHLLYAEADPEELLERHFDRVTHFHAKNVRLDRLKKHLEADSPFIPAVIDGIFTVPGDGGYDFAPLIQQLVDRDYSGWIVMEAEQDPTVAHPLSYASLGYKTLDYLLARCRIQERKPAEV